MAKVVLIECRSYDEHVVKDAVNRGIELLGGIERFARNGEQLLLKPNLLVPEKPEKCVTSHPAVFRAVAENLLATGAVLSYGDSPAMGNMLKAAKKAGIAAVANELQIRPADFKTGVEVFFERGQQNKSFVIAKGVVECDGLISLPKLKTHALERFTGCVKNQFGCVPGVLKGEYHVKLPDAHDFGKMLVDLNNYVNPRLYVMDGIQAMEGNGPRGGTPKQMNLLLFSDDPIALDATVCRLIDMVPDYVPTILFGAQSGAGTYREEEIELLGDAFERFHDGSFDIKRQPIRGYKSQQQGIRRVINNRLVPKPVIDPEKCTLCGTCISMCPARPKAIDWLEGDKNKAPVYEYGQCIRCYCCQELCPDGAIALKAPLIRRLINWLG